MSVLQWSGTVKFLFIEYNSKLNFKKEIISGFALECYKCPVNVKDLLLCSDPFENRSYKRNCGKEEDICLKLSVIGKISV
jgi:hypothetical protein